jgi:hypothetical protein|tara:strand:+ start:1377 stop:1706 length:330 start_codon:yes stop_codon:yes gene_type:complete
MTHFFQPASQILNELQETVNLAEELAPPPSSQPISEKIRGQLIPSLYEARTYIELGYYESPTVDISIKKSMLIASDLRDQNSKYAPLFSKLNILKELTTLISKPKPNGE